MHRESAQVEQLRRSNRILRNMVFIFVIIEFFAIVCSVMHHPRMPN